MSDIWHLGTVYLGLREDPDIEVRHGDLPRRTRALFLVLILIAATVAYSAVVLVYRLINGGDTSLDHVLLRGAIMLWAGLVISALLSGLARWFRRRQALVGDAEVDGDNQSRA